MSLRKVAGLLGAFGLAIGLVGGGVSAAWTDQVTAVEKVTVGNFTCQISAATPASPTTPRPVIATDRKSVTFTTATIMSSAAGSIPFGFTVRNYGTIPMVLTVEMTPLVAPWSSILVDPVPPSATINANGTKVYAAGIKWTELGNANIGQSVSITYTVHCAVPH
jgi:predicted ribosomally synthesized peptide with SipW-like signal peptide